MAADLISYRYNTPPKSYGKTPPSPAYALLADLQSTTAHLNSTPSYKTIAPTTNYYGSSSPRFQPRSVSRSPLSNRKIITEKYEYKPRESPIYQNQDFYMQDKSRDQSNLTANLSELDSLLEELNSARYGSYPRRKVPPSPPNRTASPSLQRQSLQEHNSSVESLLDDLQNAVPNQTVKHSPIVTRRTIITTTRKAPSPSKHVSPSTFAAKDLDDLMACLTEFQVFFYYYLNTFKYIYIFFKMNIYIYIKQE